jgi:hypothetical protein
LRPSINNQLRKGAWLPRSSRLSTRHYPLSSQRRRRVSSAGRANNSILCPIAVDAGEGLTFRMMKTIQSDETAETISGSHVALARGVLVQAKQDLRRFRGASDRVGREMYRDAHSWIASNDFTWPYSFVNVCQVLGLSPEVQRAELLSETPPDWYSRSRRMAQTLSSSFRGSLARVFAGRGSLARSRHSSQPVLAH